MTLMEESLHSFPYLETLVCSSAVCSSDILLHLPPTVRSLTIIERAFASHRCPDFTKAMRDCLAGTEGRPCQRRLLESIAIVDVYKGRWHLARPVEQSYACEHQRMDKLADVCADAGIDLAWVAGSELEAEYLRPYGVCRPYLV